MTKKARVPGLPALKGRIDAAIRWRAAEAVDPVARRAQDLHDWVARVEARVVEAERRADEARRTADWSQNELRRLAPQLAAVEARLAEIDDRIRIAAAQAAQADGAEPGDRALLDLIAAEHERIRVRLSAVASFEDRLRRLETPAG